jgi:SAM-dependent methyltransferase
MKHFAPAAERNREPIFDALSPLLGEEARVLEIGSGTGQHAAYFTERMPKWVWQPSDTRAEALESIAAYQLESSCAGFLPPIELDVQRSKWPAGHFDAVFCANVIHIAPWSVCIALLEGASRLLSEKQRLIFYGPFRFRGELAPESNRAFDQKLRSEDTRWGIRDIVDVADAARTVGFNEPSMHAMPANNHLLVFEKLG